MSQTDVRGSCSVSGPSVVEEEAAQVFGSKAIFGCSSGFVGNLGRPNSTNGSWQFNAFRCSSGSSATDEGKKRQTFKCQPEMKSFKELASESNRILTGINFEKDDDIPVHVSDNKYKPINTFGEAGFTTAVLANINKKWTKPTPVQRYAIPIILGGEDLMACSQARSGRTGAFILPILTRLIQDGALTHPCERAQPNCIILSPIRKSAMKIYEESCLLAKGTYLKSCCLYGGRRSNKCVIRQSEKLRQGCNILVSTPHFLERFIQDGLVGLKKVKYLVLDDANRLLNATFDPNVRHILEHHSMPPINDRKTLMFASALPTDMQILAQKYLRQGYTFLCVGIVKAAKKNAAEKSRTPIFDKKHVDLLKQDVGNSIPIIVLNSGGEESGKNKLANKIGNALEDDATSSRQVPSLLHDVKNRKRKFEQSSSSSAIGGKGSCDEPDILQSTSSDNFSRQIPIKMTNEPSCSKRVALSASPLRNAASNECQRLNFSKNETADNVCQIPLLVIPSDKFDNVDFANLRPVIIDGSNVAMRAGYNKRFNCRGILLAVKTFVELGHRVLVFLPQSRMKQDPYRLGRPIEDQYLLDVMEDMGLLGLTPGRHVIDGDGRIRRYQCYDDITIVQYAHKSGGIILSVDNYLDVARKHPDWAPTIADRLLMFTWVDDEIILPEDPHGKDGPSLDDVLRYRPGEIVENRKKPMDQLICREMLHKIHVALHLPAAQTRRSF